MLDCPKCQSTKKEQVGVMDCIPYPITVHMKCLNEKCRFEWIEHYFMNQKFVREKEKGKTSIYKVNPRDPDLSCPNCKNLNVTATGEVSADKESIGMKIECVDTEFGKGCGLKYEENYYLDKLRDTKTGKEIKVEQRTLDEKPEKVKATPKLSKSKPKPKPVKAAKTGNHTKKDLDKKPIGLPNPNPVKPKGSISATNKYIKSGNDKLIQKRLKEREQRSKKRNKA